jgi:hypothetical protein
MFENGRRAVGDESGDDATRRRGRELSGTYRGLYDHLEHRHADTVVLTFGQIEDLLGFALPDRARTDRDWWIVSGASPVARDYPNAWTLTHRTARPNFLAGNVMFERTPDTPRP